MFMNRQKFWTKAILSLFIFALGAEQSYAIANRQITDPVKRKAVMSLQQNNRKVAAKHLKIKYEANKRKKLFNANGTPKSGKIGGFTGKGKSSSPKLRVKK
jgi:hypothetical protein